MRQWEQTKHNIQSLSQHEKEEVETTARLVVAGSKKYIYFNFESKENKIKREMQELANEIAQEAARNFDYNPDEDPELKKFRRKMGLPLKRKKNTK